MRLNEREWVLLEYDHSFRRGSYSKEIRRFLSRKIAYCFNVNKNTIDFKLKVIIARKLY